MLEPHATLLECDTALLCPKPWPCPPACLLPALELVITSIRVTSHWTNSIWEKVIFGSF